MNLAPWAVIAADLVRTGLELFENGSEMTPEEVERKVAETKARARRTVAEMREALSREPGA